MHQSKLLQLIRAIPKSEIEDLIEFSESSYLNKDVLWKESRQLLLYILKFAPTFDGPELSKERVHEFLHPSKPFKEIRVEKTMSVLHNTIRRHLLYRKYFSEKNETQQWLDISEIFDGLRLEQAFKQALEKADRLIELEKADSPNYYFNKYKLNFFLHEWESSNNKNKGDINIPNSLNNLSIYYYLINIGIMNKMLLQSKVTNLEIPKHLIHSLKRLDLIPEEFLKESKLLSIIFNINKLYQINSPKLEDFYYVYQEIAGAENSIGQESLSELFSYLRNLCVILVNKGHYELLPVLHRIQQDNLTRGYYYFNGRIPVGAYLNIARSAILVNNLEWAEEFIELHKDILLNTNEKEIMYTFNMSQIYFAKKEFNKAYEILPETSSFIDYHIAIKRLELKLLYELNADLLSYKLDAFKMYIFRASKTVISPELKEFQNNFINLLGQILNTVPGDVDRLRVIQKRIRERDSVAERDWLLEKAKALEKSK